MELNMKVLVKVAVMLFLLGFTATVEARSGASSFIKEVVPNTDAKDFVKSTTTGFQCRCRTLTIPYPVPITICRCPGEACFAGCSGTCSCVINEFAGTRNCNCLADETKLSPGAGAHKV